MPKPNAEAARLAKRAKKAEEKHAMEEKKRAAENMIDSLFPQSSADRQAVPGRKAGTAKRHKGSSRTGGHNDGDTRLNDSENMPPNQGVESESDPKHTSAETAIKEYYSSFYEGFKNLVDCCPTLNEEDFENRKQFTLEAASLDRFKRNMSRAATRYLLPVLEEQLQEMKFLLPEDEVKALKQKYRHKVPQPAFSPEPAKEVAESHEPRDENPIAQSASRAADSILGEDEAKEMHRDAADVGANSQERHDDDEVAGKVAADCLSDRESTPEAERLLISEIQQAGKFDARPSGVHGQEQEGIASGVGDEAANGHSSMDAKGVREGQDKAGVDGVPESMQLAACPDAEGAAKLLRAIGLPRLADTALRCSMSARALANILDSIPADAFTDPAAVFRSARVSNGSEKSAAETVAASTAGELNVSESAEARVEPADVLPMPTQQHADGGMHEVLQAFENTYAGFNHAAVDEDEDEGGVEPCGRCRRCNEGFKLDDPKRLPKLLVCCHTLCAGCVSEVSACPWCAHPVRRNEKLQEDRLEVEQVLCKCEECDRGSYAVTSCLDCNKRLCHDCNDGHSRVALSKDHRVRELSQAVYVPKQFCVTDGHDHGPFEVYCKTCDTILCAKGFMQDHMVLNHDYSWIQQVSDADKVALAEHQSDIEMVLKYSDPRNVRRKVICADHDDKFLEKHLDDIVRLVKALRADVLKAFRSKVKREVAALLKLKSVPSRPARQAIRYCNAMMTAAVAHNSNAGGVVHHYVLHKTAKDALVRYKESVLDTEEITSSVLHDKEEMEAGSPLQLFRDRLIDISSTCSDIGNRLLRGSAHHEDSQQQAAQDHPPSPVLDDSHAAASCPLTPT